MPLMFSEFKTWLLGCWHCMPPHDDVIRSYLKRSEASKPRACAHHATVCTASAFRIYRFLLRSRIVSRERRCENFCFTRSGTSNPNNQPPRQIHHLTTFVRAFIHSHHQRIISVSTHLHLYAEEANHKANKHAPGY
jgi:hypothetical protein